MHQYYFKLGYSQRVCFRQLAAKLSLMQVKSRLTINYLVNHMHHLVILDSACVQLKMLPTLRTWSYFNY